MLNQYNNLVYLKENMIIVLVYFGVPRERPVEVPKKTVQLTIVLTANKFFIIFYLFTVDNQVISFLRIWVKSTTL